MATWNEYKELFPAGMQPVVEALESTVDAVYSIGNYEDFAVQDDGTIITQLSALESTDGFLVALADYYLSLAADVPSGGEGSLTGWDLVRLKMAVPEMAAFSNLQAYFEASDDNFADFKGQTSSGLAAKFGPAHSAENFWASFLYTLRTRMDVLGDGEFGGFVQSLPLGDQVPVESFLKLLVAADAEFDLEALGAMDGKELAGKLQSTEYNFGLRYHWGLSVVVNARDLIAAHYPDDQLDAAFYASMGREMTPGLMALQKSLVAANVVATVRDLGGVVFNDVVTQMDGWNSGHQFFHGYAAWLLNALRDYQRLVAEQEQLPVVPITFQIRPTNTDARPLGGLLVRVTNTSPTPDELLGIRMLDFNGIAAVQYEGSTASSISLVFEVMDAEEETLVVSDPVAFDPATETSVEVEVAVPALPVNSDNIAALAAEISLTIPSELSAWLVAQDIETLDGIRRMGGLAKETDTAITENLAVAQRLDHHSLLELVEDDAALREFLIDAEYTSPSKIAAKTRAEFVGELTGATYGEVTLAGVYLKAAKTNAVLGNLLMGLGGGHASNYKNASGLSPSLEEVFARQCDCEECRSGVSPLAYLAALLGYGIKHLRNGSSSVDVDWFQDTFHQAYCELPANCAAVEKKVCQIRIAIEVVRQYMGGTDVTYAQKKPYLVQTYELLLNQCGVTADEVRLAALASSGAQERVSVAERMGIAEDKINEFYLTAVGVSPTLTEDNLELLFGFQSTLRNPYSDGLKLGDTVNEYVYAWQFEGVKWGRNTDADGYVYLKLVNTPVDGVEVYRDSSRGGDYLVASGSLSSLTPITAELVPQNDSGLSGRIEMKNGFTPGTTDSGIRVSVVPQLVAWRLARQRERWMEQDWPTRNTYMTADRTLPIVEPDWMGPDDMRDPTASTTLAVYHTYDVWVQRRKWVDEVLGAMAVIWDDMDSLMDTMADFGGVSLYYQEVGLGTTHSIDPWDKGTMSAMTWGEILSALDDSLKGGGTMSRGAALLFIDQNMHLELAGFGRLMELYRIFTESAFVEFTPEQREDLHDILCQSAKAAYYSAWITEEGNRDIELVPSLFWRPIHEPKEGKWNHAFTSKPFYLPAIDAPFLDPVEVGLLDLPEPVYGATQIGLWQARGAAITAQTAVIYAARTLGTVHYLEMVDAALSGLPTYLGTHTMANLLDDLNSEVPATYSAALDVVHEEFLLTEEEYRSAMKVVAKEDQAPLTVTDADYEQLAQVLVHGWRRSNWGAWQTAEAGADLDYYWQAYKQLLPKSRGGKEMRKLWLAGLDFYSRTPIVDPDLIKAGDIVNPEYNANATLDNPAYVLWRDRDAAINTPSTGWLDVIVAEDLDDNVEDIIGVDASEVQELRDLYVQNKDVGARMAQLNLTAPRLILIGKLIDMGSGWSDADWEACCAMLLQIKKERAYGGWNLEEREAGITLGPDYFQPPYENYLQYHQYLDAILLPWRTSPAARRDWQDRLDARMDQERSLIEGNAAMVKSTEDRVLIRLRDILVRLSGATGATLEEKGEYLTEKLLIDFRTQCCNETTRVAQAIETLQVLYFSIRTGAIVDDYPNLRMDVDDWDADWKWLGTYGTWRSLMFVYLYPENVLLPSLKDKMSGKLRGLMGAVRDAARFTPDMACEVMHDYEGYLKDMASLSLQATVTTTVHVEEDGCGILQGFSKDLDFNFALGGHTLRVYYCTVDRSSASPEAAQSTWEEVPGMEKIYRIVGATPFKTKKEKRYLYVFALKLVPNDQPELVVNRLNLHTMNWEGDLGDLKIDPTSKVETWGLVLAQRKTETDPVAFVAKSWAWNSVWGPYYDESKQYVLSTTQGGLAIKDRYIFHNVLDEEGVGWANDDWSPLGFLWIPKLKVLGAIITEERFLCVLFAVQFGSTDQFKLAYHSFYLGNGLRQLEIQRMVPVYTYASIDQSDIATGGDGSAFQNFLSASAKLRILSISLSSFQIGTVGIQKTPNADEFEVFYRNAEGLASPKTVLITLGKSWYNPSVGSDTLLSTSAVPPGPAARFCRSIRVDSANPNASNYEVSYTGPCYDQTDGAPSIGNPAFNTVHFSHQNRPMLTRMLVSGQSQVFLLNLQVGNNHWQGVSQHPSPGVSSLRKLMIANLFQDNLQNTRTNKGYLQEAYYLLPMFVALELQKGRYYEEALEVFRLVYDYTLPLADRKIYHGLVEEESINTSFANVQAWLDDPENPHTIAGMRANTYTRFTVFSIVRCMLEWADQEFTTDSPESVPRARTLYLAARELIRDEIYALESEGCGALLDDLDAEVTDAGWYPEWLRLKAAIASLNNHDAIDDIVNGYGAYTGGIAAVFANGSLTWEEKIMEAEEIWLAKANGLGSAPNRMCTVVNDWSIIGSQEVVLGDDETGLGTNRMSNQIGAGFIGNLELITGKTSAELLAEDDLPWLAEEASMETGGALELSLQQRLSGESGWYEAYYEAYPLNALRTGGNYSTPFIPYNYHYFCVPQNPVPFNLLLHAELNLFKIRHCRNIAGVHRELDPYGAPTDTTSGMPVIGANGNISFPGTVSVPPTPYRYEVVLARAKELVQLAGQAEAQLLNTLEKLDAERYSLLRARQDLSTAKATVKLQDLRVKEAENEVDLAEMQQERAEFQVDTYERWIEDGIPVWERQVINSYIGLAALRTIVTQAEGIISSIKTYSDATTQAGLLSLVPFYGIGLASSITAAATQSLIQQSLLTAGNIAVNAAEANLGIQQVQANWENRRREWSFSKVLSEFDVKIAGQQIKLANDRLRITGQERAIAEMQSRHAEETLEFLRTKFTNAELYQWMSGVLQRVYNFYLQHATSMAKVAQQQLAFERQEAPANLILDDYWAAPSDSAGVPGVSAAAGPDRRGLTGSARLQMDLTKLDLYAFETEKRKQQLTKTMSLAQLFPAEFEVFRQTGVLNFRTQMAWFDRDFPGHYLRLIKRVRTSVIALVPPGEGIRARLATTGVSRVVVGGDAFQTIVTRRGSESVSLTSPIDATGLFELLPDRGDMLYPFEGMGVDAPWEFRMFRAANPINFNTIADVLVTFEYTALESWDYERQVIDSLPLRISGERAFSFKYGLPDQWYDLRNGKLSVDFTLGRGDFPGLADLKVQNVTVMVVTDEDGPKPMRYLALVKDGSSALEDSIGTTNTAGVVSTRAGGGNAGGYALYTGNATNWGGLIGLEPFGTWTLDCSNATVQPPNLVGTLEDLLSDPDSKIVDILLIVGYEGESPRY